MSIAPDNQQPNVGRVDAAGARLMRLAAIASVSVACVLIVAKIIAALMTGSASLLSSLVDSLLDAFTSLINLIAVRHALQPADKEHRFGHGKAEPLAGLAQSAFIAGSVTGLDRFSIVRTWRTAPIRRMIKLSNNQF